MGKAHAEFPAGNLLAPLCRNTDTDLASEATIPSWASPAFDLSEPSDPAPAGLISRCSPQPAGASAARPGPSSFTPLMTVTETATAMRVSTKTIRRMLDRGELHRVSIGRLVRIRAEDIEQYIRAHANV
jgi:excisionase family DNA binding protein